MAHVCLIYFEDDDSVERVIGPFDEESDARDWAVAAPGEFDFEVLEIEPPHGGHVVTECGHKLYVDDKREPIAHCSLCNTDSDVMQIVED